MAVDRAGFFVLLASLLPLLVTAILSRVFPIRVKERGEQGSGPLPRDAEGEYEDSYGRIFAGCALLAVALYWSIFRFGVCRIPETALFEHRYPCGNGFFLVPAVFVAAVTAEFLHFRLLRRHFGKFLERFLDLYPERGGTLRGRFRIATRLSWAVGISLAVLTWVMGNVSFRVDSAYLSWREWSDSPRGHQRAVLEVMRAVEYPTRRAPVGGRVVARRTLELVFRDGSRLDTWNLIKKEQIALLLMALERARGVPLAIEIERIPFEPH